MPELDVDEALAFLGKYSKWHMLTYPFLAITTAFPGCFAMLNIVFLGIIPDYFCNVTDPELIPTYVNSKNETVKRSCEMYSDWPNSNTTESCPNGYTYDTDIISSIVTEWELVCDYEYMKDLSQTVCQVGVLLGAVIFTNLADKFGRKPIFLIANWGMVLAGIGVAVAPNFTAFVIFRFIQGLFQQGIILTGFVLACEIFPADLRTVAGVMSICTWAVAMMVMAIMAHFLRDWRHLQLAMTLPWVITILGYWVVPESLPWLVANGRRKEAEQILKRAAKFNNVDLPTHLFEEESRKLRATMNPALLEHEEANKDEDDGNEKIEETLTVIITHAKLRRYTIVMFFAWFVNSLVYYGLSLSTGDLAGNRYVNFLLSGVVEVIACVVSIYVLDKFGRRIPLCVYHVIATVGLVLSVVIPLETADGTSLLWLVITFNMIGRFGIASSFSEVFLYAGEIFPVNIRNAGLGICSVGARSAGLLAPFSSTVTRQVPWLPGVVFGALSIAIALMALLLPETLGRALPQSSTDLDYWDMKRGRAKSFDVHAAQARDRKRSRKSNF